MPLDPSIIGSVRAPRLGDLVDSYQQSQASALAAKSAKRKGRLDDLTIKDEERKAKAHSRIAELSTVYDPTDPLDQAEIVRNLRAEGLGPEAMGQQDDFTTRNTAKKTAANADEDRHAKVGREVLGEKLPYLKAIPDPVMRAKLLRDSLTKRGVDASEVPDQLDDSAIEGFEQGLMTPGERATYDIKKEGVQKTKQQDDLYKTWRQAIGPGMQKQGYDLTQADITRIASSLPAGLSGYKPAEDFMNNLKAKPTPMLGLGGPVIQTDGGFEQVNPVTHGSTPIIGAGGAQAQPKPPPVPTQIRTSIAENTANIGKIQQALQSINGNKDAIGLVKGTAGGTDIGAALLNKFDSKGVDARAAVADIGSLLLHDRSGASVTISESPRLKPFVPLPTDSYETAVKKLTRLASMYQQETDALQQQYPDAQSSAPNRNSGASGSWGYGAPGAPSAQPKNMVKGGSTWFYGYSGGKP